MLISISQVWDVTLPDGTLAPWDGPEVLALDFPEAPEGSTAEDSALWESANFKALDHVMDGLLRRYSRLTVWIDGRPTYRNAGAP